MDKCFFTHHLNCFYSICIRFRKPELHLINKLSSVYSNQIFFLYISIEQLHKWLYVWYQSNLLLSSIFTTFRQMDSCFSMVKFKMVMQWIQHTEEYFHLKIKYLINMMSTEVRQVIDMNKKNKQMLVFENFNPRA